MRLFFFSLLLFSIVRIGYTQGTQWEKHWWQPNGPVHAIAVDSVNSKVYLGGSFSYVGREKPLGAAINKSTAIFNDLFPNFYGDIRSAVSDDSGGWYVAGHFANYPDTPLAEYLGLAHYNKNGVLIKKFGNNIFDLEVSALKKDGNTLYVGGSFSGFYPKHNVNPFGSALSKSTGSVISSPLPNGVVNISVSDGKGGYYLGGRFSKMGDSLRAGLAHVDSNLKVTSWNPNANNAVTAMLYIGNLLYVGGEFTSIGGQSRTRLAAIDAISGVVTAWSPTVNEVVNSIVADSSTLYIGGRFTSINGLTRNRLASFEKATGNLTNWNPDANSTVRALAIHGGNLYVGGRFSIISNISRNGIASINLTTRLLNNWNPNVYSSRLSGPEIYCIVSYGSSILVGGEFEGVNNNQSISNLAAIDTTFGNATSVSPNPHGGVRALAVSGNILYAVGTFSSIGGRRINQCVALDLITGQNLWGANARGGATLTVALGINSIYIGGFFTHLGIPPKNGLMAFDLVSGNEINWFPDLNSTVYTINTNANNIFVGGQFSNANGLERSNVAAFNKTTKSLLGFNPSPNRAVLAIELHANNIYLGGHFDTVNGMVRKALAAINLQNDSVISWNPGLGINPVYISEIKIHDNFAYIGGEFYSNRTLAAVDLANGVAISWNPNCNGSVYDLAINNNKLYVGGSFTSIDSQLRMGIASFDLPTRTLNSWNPSPNQAGITKVESGLNEVFLVGSFTSIGGKYRSNLVELDANTGEATNWNPQVNGVVNAITTDSTFAYIGGAFSNVGGQTRNNLAAINISNGTIAPLNPNINGAVNSLLLHDSTLYIGGSFTMANWQFRNNIAAVSKITGSLSFWNPNANGPIFSMTKNSTSLFVGGGFGLIGGESRNKLAALSHSSGLATSWNPGNGATIYSMVINGNTIYVGGDFQLTYGGQSWYYYGAKNATTGLDINLWNTGTSINGNTKAIAANSSNVYLGGGFTTIKGLERMGLANLSVTNTVLPFNPIEGEVNAMALWGRTLFVGSSYASVKGQKSGYYGNTLLVFSDSCKMFKARATVSQSTTICLGDSLVISANPGTLLKYQWLSSNNVAIAGEQGSTFAARLNGSYRVVVSNSFCRDTSNVIVVATKPKPAANIAAQSATNFCLGGNVQINANTRIGLTYQWLRNDTIINGQTASNYVANTSGNYRAIVLDTNSCKEKSNAINVVVNPKPIITAQSATIICEGDTVRLLTTLVNGQLYQWQRNDSNIAGQTSNTFIASTQGNYRVIVNYGNCSDTSSSIYVKVNPKPIANITATGDTIICQGNQAQLNTKYGLRLTYLWFKNDTALAGKTDTTYKLNVAGRYSIQVKDTNNCINKSNVITIKVNPNPIANVTSIGDTIVCEGNYAQLNAKSSVGLTYLWFKNDTLLNGNTDTIYKLNSSGRYYTQVRDTNNCINKSNVITIKVNPKPLVRILAQSDTAFCENDSVVLKSSKSMQSYQWLKDKSAIFGNVSSSYIAKSSGNYQMVVTDSNNCTDTSNEVKVNVFPKPNAIITLQGPSIICEGSLAVIEANKEIGLSYQWLKNDMIISSEINNRLTIGDSGTYRVIVADSNTCIDTSNNIIISVKIRSRIGPVVGKENVWKDSTYSYIILENSNDKYIWRVNGGQKLTDDSTNTVKIKCIDLDNVSVSAFKINNYGCISDTVGKVLMVSEWVDSLDIDRDTLDVGPNSGMEQMNVLSNRSYVLTIADNWFSLSQMSGFGNNVISISVQQNLLQIPRTSLISISGGSLTKTIFLRQSASVGLSEERHAKIDLYPNPAYGEFNINTRDEGLFSYTITDVLGRVVKETTVLTEYGVNVIKTDMPSGIYFVDVFKDELHKIFKVVLLNH